MKYLAWDIGIKNLSYCMMDKDYKVLFWEVLDITGDIKQEHLCTVIQKNKKVCNKKANYYNLEDGKFYCNKHSKDFKDTASVDVNKVKCSHIMGNGKMWEKDLFQVLNKYIGYCKTHSKNYENLTEIKKENKGTLDDSTLNLIRMLDDRHHLLEANVITAENQPAFKNPKMKSIQMIIYTYFNIRGRIDVKENDEFIDRILFLSASNKLKVKFGNKVEVDKKVDTKNKYKRNKELAKLYCLEFLKDENWRIFFESHKKRDDLADTYLMNIYQIQIDNK